MIFENLESDEIIHVGIDEEKYREYRRLKKEIKNKIKMLIDENEKRIDNLYKELEMVQKIKVFRRFSDLNPKRHHVRIEIRSSLFPHELMMLLDIIDRYYANTDFIFSVEQFNSNNHLLEGSSRYRIDYVDEEEDKELYGDE
jgi:hypothetical protein